LLKLTLIALLITSSVTIVNAQTMQTSQVAVYKRIDTNVGGYLESLPNDYAANPTKKYPLLIALHGVGELGDGSPGVLEELTNIGVAKKIRTGFFPATFTVGGKSFSFIVITPQMETTSNWPTSIQAVIEYCKAHYRVDEQRVYLTGYSLGGNCAWKYAGGSVDHAETLAAALLVCPGASPTATQISNVNTAQLPIWVTNNSDDPFTSASNATALVKAINAAGPTHPAALLSIITRVSHDAWSQTYDPTFKPNGINVYEWMLSKTRGTAQSTPVTPVLTANAGADKILTLPTNSITLDASSSKVTSGTITSYSWTKVSGPSTGLLTLLLSGLQAKLTSLVAGTYVYQLTVKDSNGSTATDKVTITVNAASTTTTPPTAKVAQSSFSITLPTNSVTLDGSSSVAATGNTIASYAWVKTSGPTSGTLTTPGSAKTTVTGLVAGTYVFTLTVKDNNSKTSSVNVSVVVKAATTSTAAPTAKVVQNWFDLTLPTNAVTLDGSPSVAATGNTIASYTWSKYSGPTYDGLKTPNSAKITITGMVAGSYGFTLTVKDNNGRTSSVNVAVIVSAVKNDAPPTAKVAQSYFSLTLPTNAVTLDGSSSVAATGNSIASYTWSKYTGPTYDGLKTPNSAKITITGMVAGSYGFTLTVKDNNGRTSSVNVAVIVKAAASTRTAEVASADAVASTNIDNRLLNREFNVRVAPNPVQSTMNLTIDGEASGKTSVLIYNMAGQLQMQQEFNKDNGSNSRQINISRLPAGIYIVNIITDGKNKKTIRIVKQ